MRKKYQHDHRSYLLTFSCRFVARNLRSGLPSVQIMSSLHDFTAFVLYKIYNELVKFPIAASVAHDLFVMQRLSMPSLYSLAVELLNGRYGRLLRFVDEHEQQLPLKVIANITKICKVFRTQRFRHCIDQIVFQAIDAGAVILDHIRCLFLKDKNNFIWELRCAPVSMKQR